MGKKGFFLGVAVVFFSCKLSVMLLVGLGCDSV